VAYRVAMRAKRDAARRRAHERRAATGAHASSTPPQTSEIAWRDLQAILDEEVQALPDRLRVPFVLCCLEGRSQADVARHLGWKLGTVSSAVARARKTLQRRLARRDVSLSAGLCAATLSQEAASAAVPAALAQTTVQTALAVAADPAAAVVPAHIAAWMKGATQTMFLTKVKIATTLLVAAGLVAAGTGWAAHGLATSSDTEAVAKPAPRLVTTAQPQAAEAKLPAADDKDAIAYGGQVLGPAGQPVAGARLYLAPGWSTDDFGPPDPGPVYATTDADGRFLFKVPKVKLDNCQMTALVATAQGHGPAWLDVNPYDRKEDLTLRLVKDDRPIAGQVVDLEGRPIQDVTVRVCKLKAAPGEDLRPWHEAIKNRQKQSLELENEYLSRGLTSRRAPDLPEKAMSSADGRFCLTGFGRDRLVRVRISGPMITVQDLHILTRPGEPIQVTELTEDDKPVIFTTYYGASFRHVAVPTKPILGVVRDQDTKKPLAGVIIWSYKMANSPLHLMSGQALAQTTTDSQGRYRLTGMPKGEGNKIMVVPPSDLPYVAVYRAVPDSTGLEPVTVDVELKRGVWIEGQITDKVTGKPVKGHVEYFALYSNPNLRDYPGFDGRGFRIIAVKEDGSYRVVGLPGPGLIGVYY
ncbi:MAG: hypothetical protein L0Z62_16990, partial [Gemmataceae bacterium]|nr:hypothetical protein [Gemmataceae bacterium]